MTSAAEAQAALAAGGYDCIVADVTEQPDQGCELFEALRSFQVPMVALASRPLDTAEETQLQRLARTHLVRIVRTPVQLQDCVALVLHQAFENLPQTAQAALQQLRRCDPMLAGRKVVVIDDDIRNIFSLTSALEEHGVELHYAESGRSGIELLHHLPDADAALVDIMMPGMDGYQTIREIRAMPGFASLPIIAVTAKAMKGDRQKCIEAGASDYVAKPVDIEQLVSVLRVCIQRTEQATVLQSTGTDNVVAFPPMAGHS